MDKLIEMDELKKENKQLEQDLYIALNKIDKIKIKLQEEKVSKKDIIKIIDGGNNE